MGHAVGKYAKAISDRSGMEFPYKEMVKEWNGLLVHKSEFEAKHPQLERTKKSVDNESLKNARPSRKGVPPHVQKQNSKGAKSMGPKRKGEPGVTDKDGKVIFTKEQKEERKKNIVSPAEQKAIAAKNAARKASIKNRQ